MKNTKILRASALALVAVLSACGGSSTELADWQKVETTYLSETEIGVKNTVNAGALDAYTESNPLKIALVTDSGTLDDHSFNEASWKGVNEFAVTNGGGEIVNKSVSTGKIHTRYYQPSGEFTTATRLAAMK